MKTKLIITIMLAFLLVPTIFAAQDSLGTFQQGECIELIQICGTCTYNNITSIYFPNSSRVIIDAQMQQRGAEYNYTFCSTDDLGDYTVNGVGDLDGTANAWAYDFAITVTGDDLSGVNMLGLMLVFILIAGVLLASANFFAREQVAIKTLLIMFAFGFLIVAGQVAKLSIPASDTLEGLLGTGINMLMVLFWLMLTYYFVIYTKIILTKLSEYKKKKNVERYGNWA